MKAKVVKVNPSDLQSIMFEKSKWTVDKAKRWLKKHGFLRGEVDPGGERANYLRFRQFNPESGLRYRSIPLGKGKGIMASVAFTGRAPAANPRAAGGRGLRTKASMTAVNTFDTLADEALRIAERDGWMGHDIWSGATPAQRMYAVGLLTASLAHKAGIRMIDAEPYAWDAITRAGYQAKSGGQKFRHRDLEQPIEDPQLPSSRRNPSDDAKWAIGFIDRDGRNDRAVVYGADSNDAYRNFVRSYGRHRVFSIKRMESHFYGNPRRGYESEEIEKEKELQRLGQGQKFRHRDYEQPIEDPQLAGTRYRR